MSDEKDSKLLKEARLLMAVRDYQVDDLQRNKAAIDITASNPDSDATVLMRVVQKTPLASNGIGVQQVRALKTELEEEDVDKVIVFANRFTSQARIELREEGVEFFSERQVLSMMDIQEQYFKIQDLVEELCRQKCGFSPKSEAECPGYTLHSKNCSHCDGQGSIPTSPTIYWKQRCPVCGGVGVKPKHYSCEVRLFSDNADFHFEHGWVTLLKRDLRSLLNKCMIAHPIKEVVNIDN
jgi:Holliday junction resolvase